MGINHLLGIRHGIPVVSAGGDQQCAALGMLDEKEEGNDYQYGEQGHM